MAKKPKTNFNVNGHEYARTTLTVGKDYTGKPVQKQFYGKTMTEATNKKDTFKEQLIQGINPDLASQSLSQAIYIWLWNIEYPTSNKSSTFERYEGVYRNYIKDAEIGKYIVSEIRKITVQKYYESLKKQGKTISQITHLNKLLRKFFFYAEEEGYILRNPCSRIKIKDAKDEEILDDIFDNDEVPKYDAFTEYELQKIFSYLGHTKLRYIAITAFFTGAREGELLALLESDIKNDKLRIYKTVKNVKVFTSPDEYHYEYKVTKPKTTKSKREAPIPETLETELKKLRKLIAEEKLKAGPAYINKGLLFPSENGYYLDASNLRKMWKTALKEAGVEYKKFHALRDTYASLLSDNGASLETISRLLGHSTTRTTEKYVHVNNDRKIKEIEKLNSVLK